jgi:hypothetical protein
MVDGIRGNGDDGCRRKDDSGPGDIPTILRSSNFELDL